MTPGADTSPRSLSCQRDLFSLPREVHYLNCAYMAPLPRSAEDAGVAAIRDRRAPIRFAASRFFDKTDAVRRRFARLVGAADPSRVAIQPSVSYGISIAARNLAAQAGQTVVLLEDQFPSNVYAWRRLASERGLTIRTIPRPPPTPADAGEAWSSRVLEALDHDTAVIALPQVHWTDGTILDLEAIGREAREVGAALVVDGSQSVGAFPFDVERIRPDALVCAGYKWLLGPYSTCLAWFGPRFDDGVPLEETWIARRGSDDFQGLVGYRDEYRPGAARYDVGEPSDFIALPMLAAALDLILEWTPVAVQAYCDTLLADALERVRERGGRVARRGRAAHIAGIRLPPGTDLRRLQTRLEVLEVHASLRGDALRVSPNVYNDSADVEALLESLTRAL